MSGKGIIFVCAAGNAENGATPNDNDRKPTYPANWNNELDTVVSVAATDANDNLAMFSFYGAQRVDIAAPGVDVYSTVLGSTALGYKSGTSMAAPHVTGALALLWAQYPEESATQILGRLYAAAEPVPALAGKVRTGARLSMAGFFGIPAPGEIYVSQGSDADAVVVYWAGSKNATHYRVWRAESESGPKTMLRDWTQSLSYSDTDIAPGVTNWYFLQAATSSSGHSASVLSAGIPGFRPSVDNSRVTVSFNPAGGTLASNSRAYMVGQPYGEFPVPSYGGKAFLGWYSAVTDGARIDASDIVRRDLTTLFARWADANALRIENLTARQRYPWNGLVDVAFGLFGVPHGEYATVRLSASQPGDNGAVPLTTFVSNAPSGLTNGTYRFIWDATPDTQAVLYTNLTLSARVSVDIPSAPASGTATYNAALRSIDVSWDAARGATSYVVWKGLADTFPDASLFTSTAETSCRDSTATRGNTYHYWIQSASSGGSSADKLHLACVLERLSAPSDISATQGASTLAVTTSWSTVAGAVSYEVWRGAEVEVGSANRIASGISDLLFVDSGTAEGDLAYYWVRAVGDDGETGEWSAAAPGYRAFSAPTGVSAVSTPEGVVLSWSGTSGNYLVYRAQTEDVADARSIWATTETTWTYDLSSRYVTNYFWVAQCAPGKIRPGVLAYCGAGCKILAPVTGLTATGTSGGTMLTWNAVEGAEAYDVYASENGDGFDSARLVGTSANAGFLDANPATTTYYWVQSRCQWGTGALSAPVRFERVLPDLGFSIPTGYSWPDSVFLSSSNAPLVRRTHFAAGETILLHCGFGNNGNSTITNAYAIIHKVVDNSTGTIVSSVPCDCSDTLFMLEPGNILLWNGVTFAIPSSLPQGNYTYRCILDSGGDIAEASETNNVFEIQFVIEDGVDLGFHRPPGAPAPMYLGADSSAEPAAMHRVPFGVTGENAPPFFVTFFINNGSETVWGFTWQLSILDASGEVLDVGIVDWDPLVAGEISIGSGSSLAPLIGELPPGNYTLFAEIDPDGDLGDMDLSNNDATFHFAIPPQTAIGFQTALDCANLSFNAGANDANPPFGQTWKSAFGGSAVQFGPQGHSETSSLLATVSGAGVLSFRIWADTEENYDSLRFSTNGVAVMDLSGEWTGWRQYDLSFGNGIHNLEWRYRKDGTVDGGHDVVYLDKVSWTPDEAAAPSLASAVDALSLLFSTGGDAEWTAVTAESYSGGSCARSGAISNNQSTWLQTEVTGAGTLTFRCKASCENNWDKLLFSVDGIQKASITGEGGGWTEYQCDVSGSGSHVVRWEYVKDQSVSSGSDCCWIDSVVWTPAAGPTFTMSGSILTGVRLNGVTDVVIPEGVTEIGQNAFAETPVTSVTFPDSLRTIGVYAFHGCQSLTKVTFGSGLREIREWAFCDCRSLTGVFEVPEGVENIEFGAFMWAGVNTLVFPSTLNHLGAQISLSPLLSAVYFKGNAPQLDEVPTAAFPDETSPYCSTSRNLTTFVTVRSTGWKNATPELPAAWPTCASRPIVHYSGTPPRGTSGVVMGK